MDLALCRPTATVVIRLTGMGQAPGVHQSVAGAAVKTIQISCGWIKHRQVRDTADIEHRHHLVRAAKKAW